MNRDDGSSGSAAPLTSSTPSSRMPPMTASTGRSAGAAAPSLSPSPSAATMPTTASRPTTTSSTTTCPRARNPQIYNITLCGDPDTTEGAESVRAANSPRHGVHDTELPVDRVQDHRLPDRDDQHGDHRPGRQRHVADGCRRGVGRAQRDHRRGRRQHARQRADLRGQRPVPTITTAATTTDAMVGLSAASCSNHRESELPAQRRRDARGRTAGADRAANDGFFEAVTFIGAVPPAPADNWMSGWTSFPQR